MLRILRFNVVSLIFAFTLSTGLWAVVVNQQNPERSEVLNQTFPVRAERIPVGLVLVNDRQLPTVRVRVRAAGDVLSLLQASDFHVYVDFNAATAGTSEYPIRVETTNRRVRIESFEPDRFRAQLELLRRRDVPVQASVLTDVPFGYVSKPPELTPERVTISGPESLVDQVVSAAVDLRLDADRVSVRREVTPRLVSADGGEIRGLGVAPERVVVEVPIERQVSYRVVPVVPEVVGTVADGYQVSGITSDPLSVTVVGEPSVVDRLQLVRTEPISVAGVGSDVIRSAEVRLPGGVSLLRAQSVTVRVTVSAVPGSLSLRVVPQLLNVDPELRAEIAPSSVEVVVSGPMPVLLRLRPTDLRVTVDTAGLEPGQHQTRLRVEAPSAVRVDRVVPESVSLTISRIQR
ncbi:MAG: hypothetical protein HY329_16485 [Chloroflexi bacterium]|nr:hypothetical protein [Chloroflexota bacterium]